MKIESEPQQDPLFQTDLDAQIMMILQKVFIAGMLVGKNQLDDDMNAQTQPLNQAVQDLMQHLGQLVPGINIAASIASQMPPQQQNMAKSEKPKREDKRYPNLKPNYKKLEDQHNLTVSDVLEHMEHNAKEAAAKISKEVKRFKPKKG